jgi:hypothetical protein
MSLTNGMKNNLEEKSKTYKPNMLTAMNTNYVSLNLSKAFKERS